MTSELISFALGAAMATSVVIGLIQSSFKTDCTEAGETRIGDTFYRCEPVGAMVNGQRRAFNDAFNQP